MPTIEVDELVKTFGHNRALDGLSFTADAGEVLGVLGPNGAGKTTAINVLSTLLAPDGGHARVCGHDVVADPDAVRRSISLTGQFAAVDEVLTGQENLTLFGRLRGLGKTDAKKRGEELLERFSLTDAADQRVGDYSGGMRRRLDLAASMVVPTPVLFLDEPTTGLDPRSRSELWDVVRELRSDGLTIVLTTQYLEEADRLADHIIVIDAGKTIATGTADELKASAGGGACVVTPVDARDADALALALQPLGAAEIEDAAVGSVAVADADDLPLIDIVQAAANVDINLADVARRRPTLDDVFLQLTASSAATDGSATEAP
ncbi:MAG: ATP-binding cassette domain-containing protein [Actinomycetota bacterium]